VRQLVGMLRLRRCINMNKTGKVENEGDTREVAGFIVPKDIDLVVGPGTKDSSYEATFTINFLKNDVEKQKETWKKYCYKSLVKIQ